MREGGGSFNKGFPVNKFRKKLGELENHC
jgi:hypothetical protein